MELQEAPANYLFKLWPKIEANWVRIAWGGGVILVAAGLIYFHSTQVAQREEDAGKALTQLMMTSFPRNVTASQQADLFLKVATEYQGTTAGQRALLQGAVMLFTGGSYGDAQIQFQKFLNVYPGSSFAAQADLGVATCLDAQGKMDAAAVVYQRIINTYSDAMAANSARFGLAQIDERQGKFADAINLYGDIIRSLPNSSLSSEAGMRAMELKMKPQPASSSTTPAAPFKQDR